VGELKPANLLVNPQAPVIVAPDGGHGTVQVGQLSSNCGLSKDCVPDEFSVHVFSGKENIEGPRVCINGK